MDVYLSISLGAFHGAHYIFTQICVEAKLLEPLHWNFAWTNGRLCAFRQNQSEFLKMNTLGTMKVLLVSVAFDFRVETHEETRREMKRHKEKWREMKRREQKWRENLRNRVLKISHYQQTYLPTYLPTKGQTLL